MIIGAEIALLFIGLYALIKGQLPTSKKSKHVVRGWPARVIGIIALLPIPISFGLGLAVALLFVVQRKQVPGNSFFWVGTAIEGSVLESVSWRLPYCRACTESRWSNRRRRKLSGQGRRTLSGQRGDKHSHPQRR
jgi:hypothetical protein